MDILFVRNLFRPEDFGGNRYPWEVTRRLAARGHTLRIVTPRFGGPLPGPTTVAIHNYPVSRRTPLETFTTNALNAKLTVLRQISRRRPDVIVLSSYDVAFGHYFPPQLVPDVPSVYIYHSSFYSDAVDRLAKKPWPINQLHAPASAFTRVVEHLTFQSATRIVAVSPFSKREIEARLGRSDPRVSIIPTGVDIELFSPGDQAVARRAMGIPLDATVVVTAGRLAPVKRYDRAIQAVALLRRADPRLLLVIAGAGPAEPELKAQALSLGDGVRFTGFIDGQRLRDLYRSADACLCTSEFENWSLSILESLACGTPVLGTPRGSIPDILRMVDQRLILSGVSPEEIAADIGNLIREGALPGLRERARSAVVQHFSWDRTVAELERELRACSATN